MVEINEDWRGFGTKLIETTARSQLGGTVEFHWHATGLAVEVAVPLVQKVTERGMLGHLIGLRRELWCRDCGEPPSTGWTVAAAPSR